MQIQTAEAIKNLQVLIIPVAALIITQIIKLVIEIIKNKKIDIANLIRPYKYGGMPSSHSAGVVAATITVGLVEGGYSTFFALTLLMALIVIRDALGLRMELSKHGIAINKLIAKLPDGEKNGFKKQSEKVGHTLWEVLVGIILGAGIAVLLWWIINTL